MILIKENFIKYKMLIEEGNIMGGGGGQMLKPARVYNGNEISIYLYYTLRFSR